MFLIIYLLCCSLNNVSAYLSERINSQLPEDGRLNFTGLAAKYGLQTEEFDVITEDNYILKIFHIQGDRTKPILLVPGATESADAYIIRGNTSLSVALAREGYDLWFMNVRGKKYSRRHLNLDPHEDMAYWNFSFHEIGIYDLAANIDFVLNKTSQSQITLIGFSQGNQVWYVLGSMKPEYNGRVKAVIALAPVAFQSHARLPESWSLLNNFLRRTGNEELFPENSSIVTVGKAICSQLIAGANYCLNAFLFPISGYNPNEVEPEFMPVIIGHSPRSVARKVIDHMVQVRNSRRFQLYDYGMAANLKKYGSTMPPEYPLKEITTKVELLVGPNDQQAHIKDVQILKQTLSNSSYHEIDKKLWGHVDFVWGKNMNKHLFPLVLNLLKMYN
ncbi:unnamed protein product [Diatraea saccharalis]|uniref:Lipase n=1 Tax=Diatraea saccharalis TaxID=40085 RepID=A0A9N9R210_9NEOP|nr:unnamed protein product [Diatraea saccharalis]